MRKKIKCETLTPVTMQTRHLLLYGLVRMYIKQARTTNSSLFKKIDFRKLS